MSLLLKITELGTNSEGSQLFLSDSTGSYVVTDNEGGYGAPNPERLNLALILVATWKQVKKDVPANIEAYDPLTATSFSIALKYDGWLKADLFAVPILDTEGTYSEGDFAYDGELKQFNGGVFEVVPHETLLESEVDAVSFNRLIPIKITNVLSTINKEVINAEDDDVFVNWQRRYDVVYGHLNGAKEYFCAANYYEAQKIIETAEDYYKEFC